MAKIKSGGLKILGPSYMNPTKAEFKATENKLARHAKLTQQYVDQGMDKSEASKKALRDLKEDVPTNAIGTSSSTPGAGAIDTYDPVLDLGGGKVKNKMRKKLFDILRRKLERND